MGRVYLPPWNLRYGRAAKAKSLDKRLSKGDLLGCFAAGDGQSNGARFRHISGLQTGPLRGQHGAVDHHWSHTMHRLRIRLRIARRFCRQIWRDARWQGFLISVAAGIVESGFNHLFFGGTPGA